MSSTAVHTKASALEIIKNFRVSELQVSHIYINEKQIMSMKFLF